MRNKIYLVYVILFIQIRPETEFLKKIIFIAERQKMYVGVFLIKFQVIMKAMIIYYLFYQMVRSELSNAAPTAAMMLFGGFDVALRIIRV